MSNECPIVLVHGLFGYGSTELLGFNYWGQGKEAARESSLQCFEASVGPISSSHDQACEVFAQITGRPVDYGEAHSEEAGHDRFDTSKKPPADSPAGFYPQWSADHPVHFVGHSMGGPTMRMLQHLLEQDYWQLGTNAHWIKSISGISPVFNGSTLPYLFGCDQSTGLIRGVIGLTLARLLELTAAITSSKFEQLYDFDLGQWQLTRKDGESLGDFIGRISQTQLFKGEDNAVYDLTIQSLLKQNKRIKTFDDTYYFSYVTEQTFKVPLFSYHLPRFGMNKFLWSSAMYMGVNLFFSMFYPGFNNADWRENDGAVPSYSQKYPRIAGDHKVAGEFTHETDAFSPGQWYWQYLHDRDHLDVAMLPEDKVWQKEFYAALFRRLAALN